ncbi:MAG: hypothetical protein V4556_10605 [Bacteroidota bacterium]
MAKKKVILRANGTSLIGFGHIYRLLALADILKDNFHLIFVLYKTDDFIQDEIKKYCDEIIILDKELPYKTSDEIKPTDEIEFDLEGILKGNEIVVLDGYYFGSKYQQEVKEKGCKLVSIDDLAVNHFYADAVINHAPGIDPGQYTKESYTKLYTGLDHAILRKPFFAPFKKKENNDVFISLGGSDYFQITEKLVTLIAEAKEFNSFHIMYSSSYDQDMIERLKAAYEPSGKIKFYKNLSADQIITLMDNCKYAFVPGSTVLLEAYSRGLICFTGHYTTNQLFIYNGFIKENKAIGLGDLKSLKKEIIHQALLSKNTVELFAVESDKNLKHIFSLLSESHIKVS